MTWVATRARAPRIVLVAAEDAYINSHRLPVVAAAVDAGYDVTVITRITDHGEAIRSAGAKIIPFLMARGRFDPFGDLAALRIIIRAYTDLRPSLVHHVAVKPVILGSLAARLTHVPHVVNALGGLGYVFSSAEWRARAYRPLVKFAYRTLLCRHGRDRVIVQNPDDLAAVVQFAAVSPTDTCLIRGAGVDTTHFIPTPVVFGAHPLVLLPARVLRDKGVSEFVEAARMLRAGGSSARFAIAGGMDIQNPTAIPDAIVASWVQEGVIEWLGHRDDMVQLLSEAAIVCLPSYREGLPKALLEASACGRPMVTTDVPGCREVVRNGVNGFLVPARNAAELAVALRTLLDNPILAAKMGRRARAIAVDEFRFEATVSQTMELYRELLGSSARPIAR